VALTGHPEQVVLSVTDNGPGIPAELTGKIFEPFYQVESSELNTGGTGVGLSLTKELVTLHKGTISVSSEPNVKTCFTVTLANLPTGNLEPLQIKDSTVSPENVEIVPLTQRANLEPAEFAPLTRAVNPELAVILVAEDNDDVRNYLEMNLTDDYKVIATSNGLDGFREATETIPDLVISDIMMPGMNGLELCHKLKTDEKTSHIPVILLTARQSDQYQAEGYETGADAYIAKPFSTALLKVRIKNLIESRKKLRQLFSQSTGFDTRLVGINEIDKAFLSKVNSLVEEHMSDENFDVEWLASQLFMSRTQLYRKIKALTDQSVHEFVTTIRLKKAAELLLEGKLSVAEIAFMVGYSDATGFSRSFQKQFGQPPKKFSQQQKSNLS
jgi:DNA-binding response OmpR family regulator